MRNNQERFSFRRSLFEPNPRHPIQSLRRCSPLSESSEKAHLCPGIEKNGQYYRICQRTAHDREEWSLQGAQESGNYLIPGCRTSLFSNLQ